MTVVDDSLYGDARKERAVGDSGQQETVSSRPSATVKIKMTAPDEDEDDEEASVAAEDGDFLADDPQREDADWDPGLPLMNGVAETEMLFNAYDCSSPADPQATIPAPLKPCQDQEEEQQLVAMEYRLLQRARRLPLTVVECVERKSRLQWYCSPAAGHNSMNQDAMRIAELKKVSMDACRRAATEGKWVFKGIELWHGGAPVDLGAHGTREVAMNTTSYHLVQAGGYTYPVHNDIHCEGSETYHESPSSVHRTTRTRGLVTSDFYEVQLHTRHAHVTEEGDVILGHNGKQLPCNVKMGGCDSGTEGTYVWDVPSGPDETCRLFTAREVLGVEVVADDQEAPVAPGSKAHLYHQTQSTVFVSTDQSMLRLTVQYPPVSRCGSVVYRTDHPEFFLTREVFHRPFTRKLPASERSILGYVNLQDAFLYETVMDSIEDMARAWKKGQCEQRFAAESRAHARRLVGRGDRGDGQMNHLGGGRYLTKAGEVDISFRCRPVVVKAMASRDGKCYNALPVALTARDAAIRDRQLRPEVGAAGLTPRQQLFMAPETRQLITDAAEASCDHPLAPQYENKWNNWLQYRGDSMVAVAPPKVLEDMAPALMEPERVKYDWPEGGVYSYDDAKAMEGFFQNPYHSRAVSNVISSGTTQPVYGSSRDDVMRSVLDYSVPTAPQLSILSYLEDIWHQLESWGSVCSVLVALGFIWQIFNWALGFFLRFISIPLTKNPCLHALSACFPAVGENLMRGTGGPVGSLFQTRKQRMKQAQQQQEAEEERRLLEEWRQIRGLLLRQPNGLAKVLEQSTYAEVRAATKEALHDLEKEDPCPERQAGHGQAGRK